MTKFLAWFWLALIFFGMLGLMVWAYGLEFTLIVWAITFACAAFMFLTVKAIDIASRP